MRELLGLCKEAGIHTAVETSGYAAPEAFREICALSDMMICDLKVVTPGLHQALMGTDNRLILDNLDWLDRAYEGRVWIRVPVIPGCNGGDGEVGKISRFLAGKTPERVGLLPYHNTGAGKYLALGRSCECGNIAPPDKSRMDELRWCFADEGVVSIHR